MAVSNLSISDNTKDLICLNCNIYCIQPTHLPCHHTFCLKCLRDYWMNDYYEVEKPCPLCRREEFKISSEMVEALDSSEHLIINDPVKEAQEVDKKSIICERCAELGDDAEVEAKTFCTECKQPLCLRCVQLHSNKILSRSHQIIDIQQQISTDEEVNSNKFRSLSSSCANHNISEHKLYCKDCMLLLCSLCNTTRHNEHKCVPVAEIVESKKKMLLNDQLELIYESATANNDLVNVVDQKKKFIENVSEVRDSIEHSFAEILQLRCSLKNSTEDCFTANLQSLFSSRDDMMHKLETIKETRVVEIENYEDLIQLRISEYKRLLTQCNEKLKMGTDCEIIRFSDFLHKRIEELIKSKDEKNKQTSSKMSVSYVPPPPSVARDANDPRAIGTILLCAEYHDRKVTQEIAADRIGIPESETTNPVRSFCTESINPSQIGLPTIAPTIAVSVVCGFVMVILMLMIGSL